MTRVLGLGGKTVRYKLRMQMNAHEAPNVFSNVHDILPADTELEVVEFVGSWAKTSDGFYVMKSFLEEI